MQRTTTWLNGESHDKAESELNQLPHDAPVFVFGSNLFRILDQISDSFFGFFIRRELMMISSLADYDSKHFSLEFSIHRTHSIAFEFQQAMRIATLVFHVICEWIWFTSLAAWKLTRLLNCSSGEENMPEKSSSKTVNKEMFDELQ